MSTVSSKKSVRIGILDSDPVRFVGFASLLSQAREFKVQAVSMQELDGIKLDVLIVSKDRKKNWDDVLAHLRVRRPDLRVVISTTGVDEEYLISAVHAGAKACIDEAAPADELIRIVRAVHAGSIWAPRALLASVVERAYNTKSLTGTSEPFTKREKEVLRMLVAGRTNREIAEPLGIEVRTVKAHVAKLMRKVGVENRIMLSMQAIHYSLVTPE